MSQYDKDTKNITNNKSDFINDDQITIIQTVNVAILSASVALFGIMSNIVNIVVFVKQGLNDTVNISLFALAISDLCSLVTLEWLGLLRNPLFCDSVPLIADEFQHLTAGWPHACFARITSWITVYITTERCLCVVVPLKIKSIITPRVTVWFIVSIYGITFLSLVPDYSSCYIDWKHVPGLNLSKLGLVFLEDRDQMAAVSFIISAVTQLSSFGAVIVFTAILVFTMKQKTKWRQSTSSYGNESSKDVKDKKIIKMITLVAVIYCICFLPMLCSCIIISVVPGFIIFGTYSNSFFAAWSVTFFFDAINSSANIFVYHRMSTKYRTTFDSLFAKSGKMV